MWFIAIGIILSLVSSVETFGYYDTIRLISKDSDHYLSSSDIRYEEEHDSYLVAGTQTLSSDCYFTILPGDDSKTKARGEPVKCGDLIRLQHNTYKRYICGLNELPSPLDMNEERVAAVHTLDNTSILRIGCQHNKEIKISDTFSLIFKNTTRYLTINVSNQYHKLTMVEITAQPEKTKAIIWQVKDGIFFDHLDN